MCFENRNRNRRVELICECREVRSDRDNKHHCDRNRDRDDRLKCHCKESRRKRCNFGW